MRPEGTRRGKRVSWTVLGALFVVPLLVVASLIGLVSARGEDRITAAIVNLDEGTEIDGQTVPMGRQLAAEMMKREGTNIQWVLADEASGDEGLETGEYAAVVTIPADFSETVMSFASGEADDADQARIDVTISRNAPAGDATLAQEIARIATATLNDTLTAQYLDGIYIGFNEVGDQFGQIVDGANELHGGASQLADGLRQTADGSSELVDGAAQLSEASGELVEGGEQLADGTDGLSDGANQLADGASALDDGVQEMAGQMPQLTDGVGQLAQGAEQLLPGVEQYVDGVRQLGDGLDQAVDGLDSAEMDLSELQPLVEGSQELADGAEQLAAGVDEFVSAVEPLEGLIDDETVAAVEDLQEQVAQLGDFATLADEQLRGLASGEAPLPPEVQELSEQLKAEFVCPVEDTEQCEQLRQAYEQGVDASLETGVRQGASAASDLLNATEPNTGETYLDLIRTAGDDLSGTVEQVAEGLSRAQEIIPQLQEMRDGADQLADGNRQLADGIAQMVDQLPREIQSQLGVLREGLTQLAGGADELVDNGDTLSGGSAQLLAGIRELNSQVSQLPAGVEQLANGTGQLADGADQLSDGIGEFRGGVLAYVDGVWQYTQGVDQLAAGAPELADGLGQLADGAEELADGTDTFASELEDGQDQVPSYSESERDRLSEVVSSPVAGDDDLMAKGDVPMSAVILAAGVWLAALAAFTVMRPVPSDVVESGESSTALWWRTVAVPTGVVAAVGLVLGIVGSVLLDLPAGRGVGLTAILVLLAVVFSLTQHALAGWLGHVGRGISLVLLAVTIALGLSSAIPEWLDAVAAISPVQGGMLLTRSWLAGAEVVTSIGVLLLVGIVAGAVSWMAVGMRRQLSPAQYRMLHA